MNYHTEVELRFADLDAYGHVNNATYFTFLETARVKLFRESFIDFMKQGLLFVVARAECDFKRPITLDDRLMVHLKLVPKGRTSFLVEYQLDNGSDKLFALAKTVMVALNQETGSPTALPESFLQLLPKD